MIITGTALLTLFAKVTSGKASVELATNVTKILPPFPGKPGGRDGSVNASAICSTLFCEIGGASNVPSVIAPFNDLGSSREIRQRSSRARPPYYSIHKAILG